MSIAGKLHSLYLMGPRQPWWRPFRRRHWDAMFQDLQLSELFDPAPSPTIQ